jgi:hypothetical protein
LTQQRLGECEGPYFELAASSLFLMVVGTILAIRLGTRRDLVPKPRRNAPNPAESPRPGAPPRKPRTSIVPSRTKAGRFIGAPPYKQEVAGSSPVPPICTAAAPRAAAPEALLVLLLGLSERSALSLAFVLFLALAPALAFLVLAIVLVDVVESCVSTCTGASTVVIGGRLSSPSAPHPRRAGGRTTRRSRRTIAERLIPRPSPAWKTETMPA